ELGKGSFTLGAWVKTTASGQAILTKNDGDGSWERGEKSFYLDASGRPTFVGWGNNYIYSTRAVNDGAWHHVAASWTYAGGTGGTATIYVDGVDVTNRASTNYAAVNADNSADTLKIGRSNHQWNEAANNFTGQIDEVAIYDRALSPAKAGLLGSGANAATWQSATLGGSGLAAPWSYALPANMENTYAVHVRSSDTSGNVSAASTAWRGVIDTKAPAISGTARLIGGGVFAQTEYSISSADFFLDGTSLAHPCADEDVVLAYQGYATQLTGASASCTVSGWPQTMPTVKVCDEAGHCASAQVTASTGAGDSQISILSPADGASVGVASTVSIGGGAYDPQGIKKIVISAGQTTVKTLDYAAGVTDTLWSADWLPQAVGAYTVTAAMTDQSGTTLTDTIGLSVVPVTRTLTVATAGTGAGSVTSAPAGIECGQACSVALNHGTVITLTAAPGAGSTFAGWSGACAGTAATCQLTLDQTRAVTATFALATATPTATATPPTATATATATTPTATATPPTATATTPTATPPTPTATTTPATHRVYVPLIIK
ncbi:MAG TPA: LamG-like jellyroll fold domain-containing protein, partial [Herpetosiphonaceae bacterium]|nr:LamG-like jellyroll fold domain-containing protein [Herpetosiphonaceae bacterium]